MLGPLDASKLGFTLTHEHVGSGSEKIFGSRTNSVANAVDKLKEARDAGIDTIVDVTTFDIGRDIRFREEISRKSGMQIVAGTGQHFFAPESFNARTVEEITELFIREIEQGIEDTDIKAGVIKVAARSDVMTPAEEKVFKAAARASKATGIPIETHTNARRRAGEKQVEIFEAEGVSPARVSLGHSDDTDDVSYLIGLAKRGYTLGMDHIFRGMAHGEKVPWQRRADYIKQLIDAGFVDKIFLSNDWVLRRHRAGKTQPGWHAVQHSQDDSLSETDRRITAAYPYHHRRESRALLQSELSVGRSRVTPGSLAAGAVDLSCRDVRCHPPAGTRARVQSMFSRHNNNDCCHL